MLSADHVLQQYARHQDVAEVDAVLLRYQSDEAYLGEGLGALLEHRLDLEDSMDARLAALLAAGESEIPRMFLGVKHVQHVQYTVHHAVLPAPAEPASTRIFARMKPLNLHVSPRNVLCDRRGRAVWRTAGGKVGALSICYPYSCITSFVSLVFSDP